MVPEFEYGPLAKGAFIALASLTPVVLLIDYTYIPYYLALLLFLAFLLRPFLLKSGLYALWNNLGDAVQHKWDKKYLDKRAQEIDKKVEMEKYRRSRVRDPRLPKNW
jgi:hypothetical protein